MFFLRVQRQIRTVVFLFGMRKTRQKQLAKCNSSKTTRRKQLVEIEGRKMVEN